MPFDLLLQKGDLKIAPFDLVLNTPGLVAVAQRIAITLNTFRGEYFLNTNFGAPWFQVVLRKGISKNIVDSQISSLINGVEGVIRLQEYNSVVDPQNRCISISFQAVVEDGIIDANLDIEPGVTTLCVYNAPGGNNVIFIGTMDPGSPDINSADLDFDC